MLRRILRLRLIPNKIRSKGLRHLRQWTLDNHEEPVTPSPKDRDLMRQSHQLTNTPFFK